MVSAAGSFRGKYHNLLSIKQNRPTNMEPQFLWSCLTNRTMSSETYLETGLTTAVLCISVVDYFEKISFLDVWLISECTS